MSQEHDIALVPLSGDLTAQTAPALARTIERLAAGGCHRIVLNFSGVSQIDSAGMAYLVSSIGHMRAAGGLLSLVNVSPHVMHLLKVWRIVDLVPVRAEADQRQVLELGPQMLPLWRRTLPVDPCDLKATRMRVEELTSGLPLSDDDLFDLTLAVGEALGNAADHTCGEGILATLSAYDDRLVIEVADCGDGFAVADAGGPCDCFAERGRGLRLMDMLMDAVSVEQRPSGTGMVVRLTKLL